MFRLGDDSHARQDGAEEAPRRPGKPIDVGRLLLQLLRRRRWIIAAAILGVAGGVAVAKTIAPRSFEAKTAFVWEPEEVAEVRDLRTRIDSVTLPTSLEEVRKRLDLDTDLDSLGQRITVQYDGSSNLVTVKAAAPKAKQAQQLADCVVDVFLEHQRDLERTRREEEVQLLRKDLERAKTDLEDSRDEYDAFRREHGITDLPVQRQQAIQLAAELRAKADMAEAQVDKKKSAGVVAGAATTSPRLREARQQLARARARLSDQHPRIKALEAEVEAIAESEQAGSRQAAERRQRAVEKKRERFQKVSEQARERLRELSEVEGQASALLASVQVAESHLSDVRSDLAEARDAANAPKSGFRIVAPALLPDDPKSSMRRPAAIAIPIASVLLTVLLILVNQIRGLRLHTAVEFAYWGRAAVVGSSNWPRDVTALNPFVDELGDDAIRASGRTLVLAATDEETDAAHQLASRLELVAALREGEPSPSYDDAPWADGDVASREADEPLQNGPADDVEEDFDDEVEEQWFGSTAADVSGGRAQQVGGTALAQRGGIGGTRSSFALSERLAQEDEQASVEVYVGLEEGHELRRATRRADRVLVVVTSGRETAPHIMRVRARLGRDDEGVAFVVVGLPDHLMSLPDRAGPVSSFWSTRRV